MPNITQYGRENLYPCLSDETSNLNLLITMAPKCCREVELPGEL